MAPDSDQRPASESDNPSYVPAVQRRWRRSWTAAVAGVVVVIALVAAVAVMRTSSGGDDLPMLRVGSQQRAMGEMGTADMMWSPTRFELVNGVDIAAGAAPAWRWAPPTDADVAGLAQRLELAGTPELMDADLGGGWQLDGLTVAASGDWYFGPTSVVSVCADPDGGTVVESAGSIATDLGVVPGSGRDGDIAACDPTVAPSALPTEAEALAIAERVIGDRTDARFEVVWTDPSWVAIEVTYLVDGQPSGQVGSLGFGADGLSGFGRLGSAELVGDYPTISAVDAVQRLNQTTGLGVVGNAMTLHQGIASYQGIAGDEPVASMPDVIEPVDPVDSREPGNPADKPVDDVSLIEPGLPIEPMEPVEPIEPVEPMETVVTLVGVRPVLVPFYDADGGVWSLPGYDYVDADGQSWTVVAVADEYIEIDGDEPANPPGSDGEPGAVPGGAGGGSYGVIEPYPGDISDPGDSGGVIEPGFPGGELPPAPDVVGLTEAEATAVAEQLGYTVRVVARDGEAYMVTRDLRWDRVNLVIEAGVVTDAYMG